MGDLVNRLLCTNCLVRGVLAARVGVVLGVLPVPVWVEFVFNLTFLTKFNCLWRSGKNLRAFVVSPR